MSSEKKRSVKVICPNLKFIKGNIYFISNKPIKITINNKTEHINKFKLDNIALSGSINCNGINVDAQVFEEECKDGLKINLSFKDRSYICNRDIQKFGRAIEAIILGFNIMDDESFENLDNSAKENISDYYSNYYQDKVDKGHCESYVSGGSDDDDEINNNNEPEEYYKPEYDSN